MDEPEDEIFDVLKEIRDTLNRLFVCFEDEYIEIQKRKEKEKSFLDILTEPRKKILQLLFDQNILSYSDISKAVGISRQAVGQFVKLLVEKDLIEEVKEGDNNVYHDKHDLLKLIQ